jgi:hypothetical protein
MFCTQYAWGIFSPHSLMTFILKYWSSFVRALLFLVLDS